MAPTETLEEFEQRARRWLDQRLPRRPRIGHPEHTWGTGADSVAVFHHRTEAEERAQAHAAAAWQREKFDAGYGAITWPERFGGSGLASAFERVFRKLEGDYVTPPSDELFAVTLGLIAPTIMGHGTEEQKQRFIPALLRTDLLACQLFSEPGAGSDLASLTCRAERDGSGWVLNGQKTWTSGARVADYGEAICRSDPEASKHQGMTAFLVPLDTPGVEVRPIRQMTGGASFNEVFLTDVRVPDSLRLGAEGDGWKVALTTLSFERGFSAAGSAHPPGGSFDRLLALARHLDAHTNPVVRQRLAKVYIGNRLLRLVLLRVQHSLRAGQVPGPEGSIGKLLWTQNMTRIGAVAAELLGPRLTADTGEWGIFAWTEHLLGAPGYRIAGGFDEIQRNIIGERVLGLPREPRTAPPAAGADTTREAR